LLGAAHEPPHVGPVKGTFSAVHSVSHGTHAAERQPAALLHRLTEGHRHLHMLNSSEQRRV